jgi:hypothetical protein
MTAIRVAHEANGLVITVEGLDGPPTTIILGGLYPGLLGLPSPDTGLAASQACRLVHFGDRWRRLPDGPSRGKWYGCGKQLGKRQ